MELEPLAETGESYPGIKLGRFEHQAIRHATLRSGWIFIQITDHSTSSPSQFVEDIPALQQPIKTMEHEREIYSDMYENNPRRPLHRVAPSAQTRADGDFSSSTTKSNDSIKSLPESDSRPKCLPDHISSQEILTVVHSSHVAKSNRSSISTPAVSVVTIINT